MSTEITLQVDDELMSTLRDVRRRQRAAGNRGGKRVTELSEQSDRDVVVGLLREGYKGEIRKAKVRSGSDGPVGADRRYSEE